MFSSLLTLNCILSVEGYLVLVQAAQCKSVKGSESLSSITVLTGSEGTEGLEQDEEGMSQICALGAGRASAMIVKIIQCK